MGLQKGKTNNAHRQPVGSKNRSTEQLRAVIQQVVEKNIETQELDLKSIKLKVV